MPIFNILVDTSSVNLYADPIIKLLGEGFEWLSSVSLGSVIVRLLLAIMCGGFLGAERAMKRQAAGFRTYILVAVGAAVAGFTNQFIAEIYGETDVGRLGNGVVTGIGFLGAGTILITSRNKILVYFTEIQKLAAYIATATSPIPGLNIHNCLYHKRPVST